MEHCYFRRVTVFFILIMFFSVIPGTAWSLPLPVPDYDPAWGEVLAMWDDHWDGKNLDGMIEKLEAIKRAYPERVEPYLWLGKICNIKARRTNDKELFRKAEQYALKAKKIDPGNRLAFEIMIISVPWFADASYALECHGEWIEEMTPFPYERVLPPMEKYPEWEKADELLDEFADLDKAREVTLLFEEIAAMHPDDTTAQLWASRTNYHVGEYYTALDRNNKRAMPYYKKGMIYGKRAIELDPVSVPAHYWYESSVARSIQYASLFEQAKRMKLLMKLESFCEIEDPLYNFCGPSVGLLTMMTYGGWVAEKGVSLLGFPPGNVLNEVEIGQIIYPDYFFNPLTRANYLRHKGEKELALEIVRDTIGKDPGANSYCHANNINSSLELEYLRSRLEGK